MTTPAWPRPYRRASQTPGPCSGSGSGSSAQPITDVISTDARETAETKKVIVFLPGALFK